MICQYRINNTCQLGSHLLKKIGIEDTVPCRDDAFKACSECSCPHTYNYVVGSLTYSYLLEKKIKDSNIHNDLLGLINLGQQCKLGGPGTELKKLLAHLKIIPDGQCDCEWHASQMNMWGPEKCRKEISTIISWLEEESKKLNWNWVFSRFVAATLILLACRLAEGDMWSSILAKLPLDMISRR